jgi:hypothetical protein
MAENAIAIPIKVATTPTARFTVYPFALRPAPYDRSPASACSSREASTVAMMFLGNYS